MLRLVSAVLRLLRDYVTEPAPCTVTVTRARRHIVFFAGPARYLPGIVTAVTVTVILPA